MRMAHVACRKILMELTRTTGLPLTQTPLKPTNYSWMSRNKTLPHENKTSLSLMRVALVQLACQVPLLTTVQVAKPAM